MIRGIMFTMAWRHISFLNDLFITVIFYALITVLIIALMLFIVHDGIMYDVFSIVVIDVMFTVLFVALILGRTGNNGNLNFTDFSMVLDPVLFLDSQLPGAKQTCCGDLHLICHSFFVVLLFDNLHY